MSVYLGCDVGTVSLKGAAVVDDPYLAKYVRERNDLTLNTFGNGIRWF